MASNPPPIPPSYYESGPTPASSGGQGGKPPTRSGGAHHWWRVVPGFRTGKRWKQVVALIGYLVIAVWIVQIFTKPGLGALGLFSLAAVWLAANGFGIRTRLPVFRSSNVFAAGAAWVALGFAMLVSFGASLPPVPTANTGVGTGPATPTQAGVAEVTSPRTDPSPTPLPKTTARPSPTPSATPSPSPTPPPTARPTPTSPPTQNPPPVPVAFDYCGAPVNPWHYNFCAGSYIYSPPAAFCQYFNCIASFWKSTAGYVDQCNDGTYSHSGGRSGACSYHGGERRALWS